MSFTGWLRRVPVEAWMALVLALLTASAYAYVARCGFVSYDDQIFVTENEVVQAGLTWQGLAYAFTHAPLNLYTPLALVSHMLDCQVFGVSPAGHHLTSLVIHILNTLLVFWILAKMTKEPWPSCAVAALFALHPMHVEAVVWIAERKEILSTLFGLLALLAYASYAERRSRRAYALLFLCLLLSLLAKPMLVTLPFLLLLLDLWPLGRLDLFEPRPPGVDGKTPPWPNRLKRGWARNAWPLVLEKIPLFLLVLGFSVGTYLTNKLGGTLAPGHISVLWRVPTVLYAYGQYIAKMFFPVGLTFFYPLPGLGLTFLSVAPVLLLLVAITILALRLAHRAPWVLVGWLWFLGTLVPVIGLLQVGSAQAYADRYTYFTYTGAFVALVWSAWHWVKGSGLRTRVAAYLFTLILLALAVQTAWQVTVWRNSESLFTHALEVAPRGNYVAMMGLGMVYYNEYRNVEGAKLLLKKSLDTGATSTAWGNLGAILVNEGKYKEAEACLRQQLAMSRPGDDAKVRASLASICVRQGKYEEALAFARQATALSPRERKARMSEVDALLGLGRLPEAERAASAALAQNPEEKGLTVRLAVILLAQGHPDESGALIHRVLRENRGKPSAFYEAARELLLIPQPSLPVRQEALAMAQRAVQISRGGQPWYLLTLGQALRTNGSEGEAQKAFQTCLALAKARKMDGLASQAEQELAGQGPDGKERQPAIDSGGADKMRKDLGAKTN